MSMIVCIHIYAFMLIVIHMANSDMAGTYSTYVYYITQIFAFSSLYALLYVVWPYAMHGLNVSKLFAIANSESVEQPTAM